MKKNIAMEPTIFFTPVYQWIRDCFHTTSEHSYKGSLDMFGRYHRKGTLFFSNGNFYYKGSFHHGRFHGYGEVYTDDGTLLYQGNWQHGKKKGFGMGNFSNSLCYVGDWKDDYPHGKGGMFQNGFKIYNGSFRRGLYDGFGTEYFVRCSCQNDEINTVSYRGFWKDGKYHGLGEKYHFQVMDGKKLHYVFYRGHFRHGKKHGQGSLYDDSGSFVYNGAWKNDIYHGFGCLYNTNQQQIFRGQFKNGFKHGLGFVLDESSGLFLEKNFFYGKPNSPTESFRDVAQIQKFLETRNDSDLDFVCTDMLQTFLENRFSIVHNNKNRVELQTILLQQDTLSKVKSVSVKDDRYDLFGNEINHPVLGSDGAIYDISSMEQLFEKDEDNEYVNISYHYDDGGQRVPLFPRMENGIRLSFYTILHSE